MYHNVLVRALLTTEQYCMACDTVFIKWYHSTNIIVNGLRVEHIGSKL